MQTLPRNRVLRQLSLEDRARLAPALHPVVLGMRDILTRPGTVVECCTFPEDGLVSVILPIAATRVEVGMIGFEGVVGAAETVLDGRCAAYEHIVQIPGFAHVIAVTDLRDAMRASPTLTANLRRLVQGELYQARHTAFVNASFGIEARLARGLLMCHDRIEGDDLALTHDVLAVMLGVRRSGVTLAVQNLEGARCIRARRGLITVLDRKRLETAAAGSYGHAEAFHGRLMGAV